jgi:DNA-binding GntR family transcriptional regulator
MAAPRVVDHLSPEPLYLQLAAILRAQITSGEIEAPTILREKALPAEQKLARETL